jgi:hypothetical protein
LFERCNQAAGTDLKLLPLRQWIETMRCLHKRGCSLPVLPLIEFAFSLDESAFSEWERQVRGVGIEFDCSQTQRELEAANIRSPVLTNKMVGTCVAAMLSMDAELRQASFRDL